MTFFWPSAVGTFIALGTSLYLFGRLARRNGWRVGRWGRFLYQRLTGGSCLRCRTDFRYVAPHDTPYQEEGGLCCFPLCGRCWAELEPATRKPYYEQLLNSWLATGKYYSSVEVYAEDKFAILTAVEAGL